MIDLYTDGQKFTIGSIDLFDFDPFHQRAGIGILIAQSFRGMGYGSASLDKLIDYVFNVLVLKQVYCNINIDNSASIDLFTKKGFKKIGTKKSWIRTSYGWKDEIMLQLINPLLKV
jgi:diamine N-acetyltransferase